MQAGDHFFHRLLSILRGTKGEKTPADGMMMDTGWTFIEGSTE
jgi:hypothetical protein